VEAGVTDMSEERDPMATFFRCMPPQIRAAIEGVLFKDEDNDLFLWRAIRHEIVNRRRLKGPVPGDEW
jgi:hypothetical protein